MEATHTLDEAELSQALALLTAEHQANTPSRMQRIAFALLRAAAPAFLVLLVAVLTMKLPTRAVTGNLNWWQIVVFALFGIDFVAIPVLWALNFRFARRLLRERKMVKRSGFADLIDSQWKAVRSRKRFVNILQATIGIAAALLFLLLVVGFLYLSIFEKGQDKFPLTILFVGVMACYGMLLLTPLSVYLVGRLKQKLELINDLRLSLLTYQQQATKSTSHSTDIPLRDYDLLAQVERAQIDRSRAESIRGSEAAGIPGSFLLRKSASAREALVAMDIQSNLHLQEHIEDLALDPKPKNAARDEKTGNFLLKLDDVPATIEYSVDDDHHMIEVLAIQNPHANEASHTDTKA
jgi:hypothetical protein